MTDRETFRLTVVVFVIVLIAAASTWFDPRLSQGYVPVNPGPTVIDILALPLSALAVLGSWLDLRRGDA